MLFPCPECRDEQIFEQPLCDDGHGPDCPEWMCPGCGFGLFLATYPEVDARPGFPEPDISTAHSRSPRGLRGLAPVPDVRRPAAALLSSVTATPPYGGAVSPVPPSGEIDRPRAVEQAEFPEFDAVALGLRAAMAGQRAELSLRETAGPTKLAPRSLAVLASVRSPHADADDDEMAVGRLVLLHDPAGQAAWNGTFRIAVFARADLDPEMAADPMLPEVTWSWLEESLAASGATAAALGGTVTVTRSSRFGALVEADDEGSSEVELRCSWTPRWDDEPGRHLQAFGDMLCDLAGLPPDLPGVVAFTARRR